MTPEFKLRAGKSDKPVNGARTQLMQEVSYEGVK
jgi:hypothetical protein